ncbi:hypothetical protein ACFL4W_05110 [Planctomycetota bacterium]
MNTLDKVAVIALPCKPYLEWIKALPESEGAVVGSLKKLREEAAVYLLPCTVADDPDDVVLRNATTIFNAELESWTPNQSLWPAGRDADLFKEWFEAALHSAVVDLEQEEEEDVEDEELEKQFSPDYNDDDEDDEEEAEEYAEETEETEEKEE